MLVYSVLYYVSDYMILYVTVCYIVLYYIICIKEPSVEAHRRATEDYYHCYY